MTENLRVDESVPGIEAVTIDHGCGENTGFDSAFTLRPDYVQRRSASPQAAPEPPH